jgi:hypothetical protein
MPDKFDKIINVAIQKAVDGKKYGQKEAEKISNELMAEYKKLSSISDEEEKEIETKFFFTASLKLIEAQTESRTDIDKIKAQIDEAFDTEIKKSRTTSDAGLLKSQLEARYKEIDGACDAITKTPISDEEKEFKKRDLLQNFQKILTERTELVSQLANVEKHSADANRAKSHPGEINIRAIGAEVDSRAKLLKPSSAVFKEEMVGPSTEEKIEAVEKKLKDLGLGNFLEDVKKDGKTDELLANELYESLKIDIPKEKIVKKIDKERWIRTGTIFGDSRFDKSRKPDAVRRNIDRMKLISRDIPHTMPKDFSSEYAQDLKRARKESEDELLVNMQKLVALAKTGVEDTSVANFKAPNYTETSGDGHERRFKATTGFAKGAVGKLARGVFTNSKPEEQTDYKQYLRKRNELLTNLLWKIGKDKSKYGAKIQRIINILEGDSASDAYGMLSEESFGAMLSFLKAEITNAESAYQKEIDAVNERINGLNEAMLKDMKDKSVAEDEMWKYRVVQVFLLLVPFLGAASALSYINPLSSLFGGVMNASGFADAASSVVTSDILGPFGYLADKMEIDFLIEGALEEVPIMSDAVDIVDTVLYNGITQGFASQLMPLMASPLLPVMIGGLYAGHRITPEIDHYEKYSEAAKLHNKDLKNEMKSSIKKLEELIEGKSGEALVPVVNAFYDHRNKLMKESYFKSAVVGFISYAINNAPRADGMLDASVLGSLPSNYPRKNADGNPILPTTAEDEANLMRAILNPDSKNMFYAAQKDLQLFLALKQRNGLYGALDIRIDDDIISEMARLKSSKIPSDKEKKAALLLEGKELLEQEFIFRMAEKSGIPFDESAKSESLEKRRDFISRERLSEATKSKATKLLKYAIETGNISKAKPSISISGNGASATIFSDSCGVEVARA